MKTLYLIRNAKSRWEPERGDIERPLSSKGKKDLRTIGSYLNLRGIRPELILSSCALRAQQTSDALAEHIGFEGKILYLRELYMTPPEEMLEIIAAQEDDIGSIFVVGHTPQLHELANTLMREHIGKFPALGVAAVDFETDSWSGIGADRGKLDFFIYPKQFKYYMPGQIRAFLS